MATSRKRTVEFEFLVRDRDAVAGLNRIEGQLGKTGKSFSNMAKGVAAYVGVGQLKDFAMGAINAASDVAESMNAVNVVFGESARTIERFAQGSADSVGLARSEFQQMAAELGSLLQGVGFSADEAADQTIALTQRASDMASIFNTDVSQALGAIQSALKGEFNPIERFGVKLSAAQVEAKALEMGLAATKKELTDTDKATAALSIVFDQTNRIAGDFANTMDGAANKARILAARTEDLKASMGERLLPVWESALSKADDLAWTFERLNKELSKNKTATGEAQDGWAQWIQLGGLGLIDIGLDKAREMREEVEKTEKEQEDAFRHTRQRTQGYERWIKQQEHLATAAYEVGEAYRFQRHRRVELDDGQEEALEGLRAARDAQVELNEALGIFAKDEGGWARAFESIGLSARATADEILGIKANLEAAQRAADLWARGIDPNSIAAFGRPDVDTEGMRKREREREQRRRETFDAVVGRGGS